MVMSTDPKQYTFHTSASLLISLREWDDKRSWEEFYGLYRELVYGFACRSGLCHDEALEATDEVFIRAAIAIQEFDRGPGKGSFRGWLMNLTRARVSERLKGRAQATRPQRSVCSGAAPSTEITKAGPQKLWMLLRSMRWDKKSTS
jgi:DNA-directed RNA polymerase specialized sigma24 family protein